MTSVEVQHKMSTGNSRKEASCLERKTNYFTRVKVIDVTIKHYLERFVLVFVFHDNDVFFGWISRLVYQLFSSIISCLRPCYFPNYRPQFFVFVNWNV